VNKLWLIKRDKKDEQYRGKKELLKKIDHLPKVPRRRTLSMGMRETLARK
ncbi:hypothetical protein THOM_2005, partial [Trachipleistophora hominis]